MKKEKIGKLKKKVVKKYSPSFLRPNMKRSPSIPATGRATVGNSGVSTLRDPLLYGCTVIESLISVFPS
jgi:hypothetical protein